MTLTAYNKIYYEKNKEKLKEYSRNYYRANKQKWKQYSKVYRQDYTTSSGEELNYWKMYYRLNKQKFIDYYKANKEKRKKYSKKYYLTTQKKSITQKYVDMIISDKYNNMLKTISIEIPKTEITQEVRILEFK